MIGTVTLNPSLDEHIMVHGLIVEEANRWEKLHRYAGGKGIDVSRAIHEMGGSSIAYGFIGGENGRVLEILLDEEGVLYSFTPVREETRTNFIITDTKTWQQTRIGAPGPRITPGELERFNRKLRKLKPSPDMMVVAGSAPPGVPTNMYYGMINEAREFGVRTILDSSGQLFEEGIKAQPYLVKPNIHEAEELLGKKLETEADIIEAVLELAHTGIEIAVISRGKEGIIAATKNGIIKAVPPPVKIKSAVGAGDCTIAGLAIKLASNAPLIEACRLAVAMGTAAVLTPGTELCHKADVERILPQVKIEEISTSRKNKRFSITN